MKAVLGIKSQSPGRSSGVEFFQVPRLIERGRFRNFSSPRDYMKAVLGIFPSPKVHLDKGVPNPIY